jgi:RNA polymerase sigma factor (sigma-70 family)
VLDVHLPDCVATMQSPAAKQRTETAERLLIAHISTGSRAALARLYALYSARLAGFFGHLTSNADLVQELIGETMLDVWRERNNIDPDISVPVWVMSIAYTQIRGLLVAGESSQPLVQPSVTSADYHCPESTSAETLTRLRDAVLPLSFEEKTVLYLVYGGGLSRREISGIMNVSSRCVDVLLTHARFRLRASTDDCDSAVPAER